MPRPDDEPLDDLEPPPIEELPPPRELLPLTPELFPLRELPLFDEPPLIEPLRDPLDDRDLFELSLFILFAITSANPLYFFRENFFSRQIFFLRKFSHF
ncbi:MAG: hypothetical protein JO314_13300 [Acidobacteria bacterium]|nr:hypothetical protein [Acidobacteriota bacterium]